MKILSKRQILMLHAALAARAGSLDGLRDEGLLDSAIHAPMQTFGGQELYPSTLEKAARLGYGLIRNHPFADGNKRIGVAALLLILRKNGVNLAYTQEELIRLGLDMATNRIDVREVALWIKDHRQE